MNLTFPNLVLLGSQKSGTTTLHSAMHAHPSIFMCQPVKEPTFFLPEESIKRRYSHNRALRAVSGRDEVLNRYMKNGYAGEPFFGDSSTGYTIGDASRRLAIPERMLEFGGDYKFLYVVRNPVERLISNFKHVSEKFTSFADFLAANAGKNGVLTSCYAHQIEAYLEHFDTSCFHFLMFEDLIADQNAVLQEIYRFLELPAFESEEDLHLNSSKTRGPKQKFDLKIPLEVAQALHTQISEDANRFATISGLDISRWSLSLDIWPT